MKRDFLLPLSILLFGCTTPIKSYKNPYEYQLEIFGSASSEVNFSYRVHYSATSKNGSCQTYNVFSGLSVPLQKTYEYFPQCNGSMYSVIIPLKEIDHSSKCDWAVNTVNICLAREKSNEKPRTCNSLIFITDERTENIQNMNLECKTSDAYPMCFGKESRSTAIMAVDSSKKIKINILRTENL
jgi:hypothetical protein